MSDRIHSFTVVLAAAAVPAPLPLTEALICSTEGYSR